MAASAVSPARPPRCLPFPAGQFDLVTSFDVLYALEDEIEREALNEMYRVLRPGGQVLVNVAALKILTGNHSVLVGEVRRYSRSELAERLERTGFEVRRITYTNFSAASAGTLGQVCPAPVGPPRVRRRDHRPAGAGQCHPGSRAGRGGTGPQADQHARRQLAPGARAKAVVGESGVRSQHTTGGTGGARPLLANAKTGPLPPAPAHGSQPGSAVDQFCDVATEYIRTARWRRSAVPSRSPGTNI